MSWEDDAADSAEPTGAGDTPAPVGRLIVVTGPLGPGCHHLAWAMARRLDQSVVVDGPILAAMVASEHASGADELGTIRTALLRYCAQIALAETYRRAGYDVLIVEDLPERRLADFRDLSAPDEIHLVVLDGTEATYPLGLRVRSSEDVAGLAVDVLARLDQALLPPHEDDEDSDEDRGEKTDGGDDEGLADEGPQGTGADGS